MTMIYTIIIHYTSLYTLSTKQQHSETNPYKLIYEDNHQLPKEPRHMMTPTASTRLVFRGISLQVPPWPMASQLATISFSSCV